MTRASQVALAVAVAAGALLVNDNMSLTQPSSLVSQSEARVGRPLTPVSVAGVARRQNRRAAYGTGIVGAGAVGTGAAIGAARYRGGYGYEDNGYRRTGVVGAGVVGTGAAIAAARYRGGYAEDDYGYREAVGTGADFAAAPYRGGYADGDYGYRRPGLVGAAVVGTGAALTAARYGGAYASGDNGYGGWNADYMQRNGIICEPGSTVRFPDGLLYLCQ
jgi:hypothetical protein